MWEELIGVQMECSSNTRESRHAHSVAITSKPHTGVSSFIIHQLTFTMYFSLYLRRMCVKDPRTGGCRCALGRCVDRRTRLHCRSVASFRRSDCQVSFRRTGRSKLQKGQVPKSGQSGARQNPDLSYEKQNDCEDRQILRPRIVYVYRVPYAQPR